MKRYDVLYHKVHGPCALMEDEVNVYFEKFGTVQKVKLHDLVPFQSARDSFWQRLVGLIFRKRRRPKVGDMRIV